MIQDALFQDDTTPDDIVIDITGPEVDIDLHSALVELEAWGQAQRADAVKAMLDLLPADLFRRVRNILPWIPEAADRSADLPPGLYAR